MVRHVQTCSTLHDDYTCMLTFWHGGSSCCDDVQDETEDDEIDDDYRQHRKQVAEIDHRVVQLTSARQEIDHCVVQLTSARQEIRDRKLPQIRIRVPGLSIRAGTRVPDRHKVC